MPEPLTMGIILSGFLNILSTVANSVLEFFKMLPRVVQALFISAVLFLDVNTNWVGGSLNIITQWIGIEVNSFILFAITFVIFLIGLMYSANKFMSVS